MLICEVTMDNFDDSVALGRAAESEQRKADRARAAGLPQFATFHEAQADRLRNASGLRVVARRLARAKPEPIIQSEHRDWTMWIVAALVLLAGLVAGFDVHWLAAVAAHLRQVLP